MSSEKNVMTLGIQMKLSTRLFSFQRVWLQQERFFSWILSRLKNIWIRTDGRISFSVDLFRFNVLTTRIFVFVDWYFVRARCFFGGVSSFKVEFVSEPVKSWVYEQTKLPQNLLFFFSWRTIDLPIAEIDQLVSLFHFQFLSNQFFLRLFLVVWSVEVS